MFSDRACVLLPSCFELMLDVVIHRKLQRVRAHAQRLNLLLAFIRDPTVDQRRSEHVALQEELVIGFERYGLHDGSGGRNSSRLSLGFCENIGIRIAAERLRAE